MAETRPAATPDARQLPNLFSVILGTTGLLALVGTILTTIFTSRTEDAKRLAAQYTEAIGHLSDPSTEQRMAGVYELGGVSQDSERHRHVAMQILAGELRILAP